MFAKAWPAEAVLSPEVLAAFKRPRGRPPKSTPKAGVAVRLDPDAVARLYRTKNERA